MEAARLMHGVARLAAAATADFSIDEMLRELCLVAVEALPVEGAGVMALDGERTRLVHASPERLEHLESLQEVHQDGPCRRAIDGAEVLVFEDLDQVVAWPEFRAQAAVQDLEALVVLPLVRREQVWGALDLYRRQGAVWTPEEVGLGQLLADLAASYVAMASDRDGARGEHLELTHRALHDQLTGLANRGLLSDRLEHALATARRSGSATAVLFVDLDRFKDVNDRYGHAVGDLVLVEAASRMLSTLREGDTLGRLSGDEFVLLCEGLPGEDEAAATALVGVIARRLEEVVGRPFHVQGLELRLTASIGVALSAPGTTAAELLHAADSAMYRAKDAGRARIVVRGPATEVTQGPARQLADELAHALARGQLVVHYQPLVAGDGSVPAVEALVRWQHPERGLLTAGEFLHLFGDAGIRAAGAWVVEQVCAELAHWQDELGVLAPSVAFCDVSLAELADPGLTEVLAAALLRRGLQPAQLGLEVIEQSFSDPHAAPSLEHLRERGHPVALDGFGSGSSSLARLVSLPLTHVKIDRTFVQGIPDRPGPSALVDAVVLVGTNLDLQVVAVGVEDVRQADHLRAAGCDLLQGTHLARPAPAVELTAWLASRGAAAPA